MNIKSVFLTFAIALSSVFPVHAVMGPMRAAKCLFEPKKWNCSEQEKKDAKKWAAISSAAVIASIATAVGIGVTAKKIADAKKSAAEDTGDNIQLPPEFRFATESQGFQARQAAFNQEINNLIEQLTPVLKAYTPETNVRGFNLQEKDIEAARENYQKMRQKTGLNDKQFIEDYFSKSFSARELDALNDLIRRR